jgi:hypothetical protein
MNTGKGKTVDFSKVEDIEEFRDYFDIAPDFGVFEKYRKQIDQTQDLETLRPLLEKESPVFLPGAN